jgi:hypothetical protein
MNDKISFIFAGPGSGVFLDNTKYRCRKCGGTKILADTAVRVATCYTGGCWHSDALEWFDSTRAQWTAQLCR